jgi:DNA-binding cell septation regulator SpoVG
VKFRVEKWVSRRSGALYGFASVIFDDYLLIADIRIMDGRGGLWAALPSKSFKNREGKLVYEPLVSFTDKEAAKRFSDALVLRLCEKYPADFAANVTRLRA